jgi:hypothetical protein
MIVCTLKVKFSRDETSSSFVDKNKNFRRNVLSPTFSRSLTLDARENMSHVCLLRRRVVEAQLVEALLYKLEGRGFDFRWCHWNFFCGHNPSGRTMGLGSTQVLTEIRTKNISRGGRGFKFCNLAF